MRHIRLYIFLFFLLIIGLGCGFVFLFCDIENVEVRGASYYSEEQVKNLVITSKLDSFAPILYLKGKVKTFDVPFVEKLDIELIDKNTVRIDVYEKVITACVEKMGQYFYFDNDGTVVEVLNKRNKQYPLVEGMGFESTVLTEKLKVENESMLDTIAELSMLMKKNCLEVSTIKFEKGGAIVLDIDGNKVSLGDPENYVYVMNNLPGILEAVKGQKLWIDMRNYSNTKMDIIAKPIE